MTKGLLLMMLFLAQAVASSAQVKLYMEDFTIAVGETKEVSLLLDNDKDATVLQATLNLPAGLNYVENSVALTSRVKGRGATVLASEDTHPLVIVETGGTITAGTGAIITLQLTRTAGLADGDHVVTISDIIISDADANQLNTEEETTVTVKALGLADCTLAASEESVEMDVEEEFQIDITLTNEGVENLSALQGKLTLPEGMEIVPGEDGKFIYSDRTPSPLEFKFQENEDGSLNFVLSSSANTLITGTSGVIFSFKVKADMEQEGEIKLEGLRVAATTGQSVELDDVVISVTVKKPYTVGDVNGDGKINTVDASYILMRLVDRTPDDFISEAADVDGDGKITTADATAILQMLVE